MENKVINVEENKKINEGLIKSLKEKEHFSFDDFVDVVKVLRKCCPWDAEQSHSSIRKNLIEETYEVVEGIDKDSPSIMEEELGDLMLQVIFHTVMGEESGEYSMGDVIDGICKKLIRRHPHIFAEVNAKTTDKVLENWDNIKKEEKSKVTVSDELYSVSSAFPALVRGQKVCKKIRKGTGDIFSDKTLTKEEAGKLLFEITSACDVSGIDAEESLFEYTEEVIKEYENK